MLVQLYELGWEYWHPKLLSGISRGVGVLLKIDDATLKGDYGHYASILIDVDLSSPLLDGLMLERNGACLFISLLYENLLEFCFTYKSVGHSNSAASGRKQMVEKISKSTSHPSLHRITLRSLVDVRNLVWPIRVLKDLKNRLLKA